MKKSEETVRRAASRKSEGVGADEGKGVVIYWVK
jgi:hypothetical protein